MEIKLQRLFIRGNQKSYIAIKAAAVIVSVVTLLLSLAACGQESLFDFNSASTALGAIISPDERTYYKDLTIPRMIEYESEDGSMYYYIEFSGIFEKSKRTGNVEDDFEFSNKTIIVVENSTLTHSLFYNTETDTFGEEYDSDEYQKYCDVISGYKHIHELTSEEITDLVTKTKEKINAAYHSDD